MEFIRICIRSNQLVYFNYLCLIMGIMILVFPYKLRKIWNWVLCIYAGGIAGFILGFLFFENAQGTLAGCIGGIAISAGINYAIERGQFFLVSSFVLIKLLFIPIMLLYIDDYSVPMFLLSIFVCFALGFIVSSFYKKGKAVIWCYAIFGVLETSANIIAVFKYDSLALDKFLYDESGMIQFFLYLLKVDFTLSDYQWPFIFLILFLGIIEIVWYKISVSKQQIVEGGNQ